MSLIIDVDSAVQVPFFRNLNVIILIIFIILTIVTVSFNFLNLPGFVG